MHQDAAQAHNSKLEVILNSIERESGAKISENLRQEYRSLLAQKQLELSLKDNLVHLNLLGVDEKEESLMQNYAQAFFMKQWVINIANGPSKFITSDCPLVGEPCDPNHFFEQTHFFPLTPQICICAQGEFPHNNKKLIKRKTLFNNFKDNHYILTINKVIAQNATEHLYSKRKEELDTLLSDPSWQINRV